MAFAPLLISGCVLLAPAVPRPAVMPVPSGGIVHDGYVLVCEGVGEEACRAEADRIASASGRGRQIRSITLREDGHELCWHTGAVSVCEGAARPAPTG